MVGANEDENRGLRASRRNPVVVKIGSQITPPHLPEYRRRLQCLTLSWECQACQGERTPHHRAKMRLLVVCQWTSIPANSGRLTGGKDYTHNAIWSLEDLLSV